MNQSMFIGSLSKGAQTLFQQLPTGIPMGPHSDLLTFRRAQGERSAAVLSVNTLPQFSPGVVRTRAECVPDGGCWPVAWGCMEVEKISIAAARGRSFEQCK